MKMNDTDGIYTVVAGDPHEEDENKIFLRQDSTFEEADALFDSLLEKREYPVILLDEGNISIRGFKAPDRHERDLRYTILKEDAYRKANPDAKPLYLLVAYRNYDRDRVNAILPKTIRKLVESEDFSEALSKYEEYADDFTGTDKPYAGIELFDSTSNRLVESTMRIPPNPEKSNKPARKKKEDPGYER